MIYQPSDETLERESRIRERTGGLVRENWTVLDEFAAKAMNSLIDHAKSETDWESLPFLAYGIAEKMMIERDKRYA